MYILYFKSYEWECQIIIISKPRISVAFVQDISVISDIFLSIFRDISFRVYWRPVKGHIFPSQIRVFKTCRYACSYGQEFCISQTNEVGIQLFTKYRLWPVIFFTVNIVRCSGVLRKKKENSFLNLAWYIFFTKREISFEVSTIGGSLFSGRSLLSGFANTCDISLLLLEVRCF